MGWTNSSWTNSSAGYGGLTKVLHWLIAALFVCQYAVGHVMTGMKTGETVFGLGQAAAYNWHKSIGLVALAVALVRLWNRRQGTLPPWAPTLSTTEQAFIHRCEQVLYAAMLVLPLSGVVYVMAGGYGVHLFGAWHLPNPLPASATLATFAK
ncbi:MAG: cytochrome b/b6 domain-containing protein, partial [Hylemonella sp.]